MKPKLILLMFFSLTFFTACQQQTTKIATPTEIKQISVEQAKTAVESGNVQFIDVRTDAEYKGGHTPKAANFPLDTLEQDLTKLDRSKPVYVICETGRRSQIGAEVLQKNGFTEIFNIEGGTTAWRKANLPIEN